MRDAVLALLLAVLQGFPLGETAPNPSPLVGSNWGNPRRYIHLQTSTDLNNFYLEIRLDGTVRKSTTQSSYSERLSSLIRTFCLISVMWYNDVTTLTFKSLLILPSRRCDFTESRNKGAHGHPRRQKQPLPVYGFGGQTIQLRESKFTFF